MVDAKTVSVVLRSRFAGWRSLFRTVLPSHVLSGSDPARVWTDGIENPQTGKPIGSGPFLVERWERGNADRAPAQSDLLGSRAPASTASSSAIA